MEITFYLPQLLPSERLQGFEIEWRWFCSPGIPAGSFLSYCSLIVLPLAYSHLHGVVKGFFNPLGGMLLESSPCSIASHIHTVDGPGESHCIQGGSLLLWGGGWKQAQIWGVQASSSYIWLTSRLTNAEKFIHVFSYRELALLLIKYVIYYI